MHGRSMRICLWACARIVVLGAGVVGVSLLSALDGPINGPALQKLNGCCEAAVWMVAFSPDGKTIAALDARSHVWLQSLDAEAGSPRLIDPNARALSIVFAPDGECIAVRAKSLDVALFPLTGDGPPRKVTVPERNARGMVFSQEGRTLAVWSVRSPEIMLWDVRSGEVRTTLHSPFSDIQSVTFGPDGDSLTSVSAPTDAPCGQSHIVIWDLATSQPRICWKESGIVMSTVSADGRMLALPDPQSRKICVKDLSNARTVGPSMSPPAPISAIALSTDARRLAVATTEALVSVWDVMTGREIYRLDTNGEVVRHVAFSPNGKILAASGTGCVLIWELGQGDTLSRTPG